MTKGRPDAEAYVSTPRSVVKTLAEMLQPFEGPVYDPACGSVGMIVESAKFVEAHGGNTTNISVYGQKFTDTIWRLANEPRAPRHQSRPRRPLCLARRAPAAG